MNNPPTKSVAITIPEDLEFSDLKLSRYSRTGAIAFDWAPIERICEVSGVDVALFRDQHADHVAGLISQWYAAHVDRGGARDPIPEELIAEAAAEDEHGGGISYPSGQA